MGAEQSSPTKGAYQPDFLTAHVRSVSSQLAPTNKRPLQGKSSMGTDSLVMASAIKAQEAVAPTGGRSPPPARAPLIDAESLYIKEMRSISATLGRDNASASAPQPLKQPEVGADSIYITQARKAAAIQKVDQRNRFALADGKGKEEYFKTKGLDRNHYDESGFETAFAKEVKKHTKGKVGHMGLVGSPDKGVPTKVGGDAYYVWFGKETHSWLAPKSTEWEQWRGIKPHTPVKDFVKEEQDAQKEKIRDASRVRAMPTPQVGPDAYEIEFAKRTAIATSNSPIKRGGSSHLFDSQDSFFTASPAIVKDAPENYQGIKPQVGPDAYMLEHAKEVADNAATVAVSREMANIPPQDPNVLQDLEA